MSSSPVPEQETADVTYSYPDHDKMKELLQKVFAVAQMNGYAGEPIMLTLLVNQVFRQNGYDSEIRVGYLFKPDAPGYVIPFPWVETRATGSDGSVGQVDITDLVCFTDNSKAISVMGEYIGFGDHALHCAYHRRVPEDTRVSEQEEVSVSKIRRCLDNPDSYLRACSERVRNVYENIKSAAKLS